MIAGSRRIIRAVIYARYSSDNQREESIDAQIRAAKKYIAQKGYVLVNEYVDQELSAKTDKRPDFQRMIHDSSNKSFDVIIVHKLNRFARNRYDSAHYKHKLRLNGVRVESATENIDGSPESVLMESLLEGMAEYYSLDLAREVEKGMVENVMKGMHVGGVPPYGLKVNKETLMYELNESEYRAVQIYFECIVKKIKLDRIAEILNEKGYRTRTGRKFTRNSFDGWARNRKYKGDNTWNVSVGRSEGYGKRSSKERPKEEQIIVPGVIPAIVTEELWDRANELTESRRRKGAEMKAKVNYLLSGKIHCETCKSPYAGVSYVNKKKRYAYYRCQGKCGSKQIGKDEIEHIVIQKTLEQCFTDNAIKQIVKRVQELYQERKQTAQGDKAPLIKEIQSLERKIDNWIELLGEGIGDKQAVIEKVNAAKEKKDFLMLELNKLNVLEEVEQINEKEIHKVLTNKKNLLLSADEIEKKEILQECVDQVKLDWNGKQFHVDLTVRFFNGAGEGT